MNCIQKEIKRANIAIHNLYCDHCAEIIKNELSQIRSISYIDISVRDSAIRFNFTGSNDISTTENCLTYLGFPPKGDKIDDMYRMNCFCRERKK
ncbi:hypothetical protein [Aquimarina sp. 2304DJ70-9]|uniref:hypothetical protein n=1 Tax=Aquimarina penaris TaxID=3231044 RepID=UPI0034620A31